MALIYEAMENLDQARAHFTQYVQLTTDQNAKDEATLHLSTLDAKKSKYDEEVDAQKTSLPSYSMRDESDLQS